MAAMRLPWAAKRWFPALDWRSASREGGKPQPREPRQQRPQGPRSPFFELDPAQARAIEDPELRSKLLAVPRIIHEWVGQHLDLSEASVLDFGCGAGAVSLGMALQLRPQRVVGVDIQTAFDSLEALARAQFGRALPPCLELRCVSPGQPLAQDSAFDLIVSWDVFEHVDRQLADAVVDDLVRAVRPGGYCLVGVAPLFYSAFGSHLATLISRPWAHLLEQHNHLEDEARSARHRLAGQGDADHQSWLDSIWGCYTSLNKFTADDLVALFERHGLRVLRDYRTDCDASPPAALTRIYSERVLKNDQIVLLLHKSAAVPPGGGGPS
jgi:SAM-dependent methyltransferase